MQIGQALKGNRQIDDSLADAQDCREDQSDYMLNRLPSWTTHFHLEPALEAIRRVGAKRTVLTHLSHEFDHFSLADELPEGVEPGYDGMVIDL